jgi:2-hydroxychromene-2-carboxylate isomerase
LTCVNAWIGCDREAVLAGMQDAATKSRLLGENAVAIRKGVFGSPFFVVDGEPFWGSDRIALLAQR